MCIHGLTQRLTSHLTSQVSRRLSYWRSHRFGAGLGMLSGAVLFATAAGGQTLFARPDTTPDYASYRDIEDCRVTILRIAETKEQIWWDTVGMAQRKALGAEKIDNFGKREVPHTAPRSDAAIQAGRICLARFNADTATFKSAGYALRIMDVLLLTHRDDDAHRFVERFLDSMRARTATTYKDQLQRVLQAYVSARPVRYAEAKQTHARILATVAADSLYRTIEADMWLAIAAGWMNDTVYENELAWHAIRTNDAVPVAERKAGGDPGFRLPWMEGMLARFTENEGFDSLSISTLAYNLWKANTVNARIYGTAPVTATDSSVQPYKLPDLVGEHYYTSTAGASSGPSGQTLASYTTHGAVPPGTLPVKGRINYLTSWPSFCHTEGGKRESEHVANNGKSCTKIYNTMRMFKDAYPDLEIIVLSDAYGTVGQLGPLEPADEADTLAKLFLGHGRVSAHLVVEHTPFFHVEAPDGRRIDLPTPQMELLGYPRTIYDAPIGGIHWLVDKEGYVVHKGGLGVSAYWDRFYTILKNRPTKRDGALVGF